MATPLTKELSRELIKYPGIIVTMTPDGITFKVKRKQRSLEVSWDMVFGAAAMIDENEGGIALRNDGGQLELRHVLQSDASRTPDSRLERPRRAAAVKPDADVRLR